MSVASSVTLARSTLVSVASSVTLGSSRQNLGVMGIMSSFYEAFREKKLREASTQS